MFSTAVILKVSEHRLADMIENAVESPCMRERDGSTNISGSLLSIYPISMASWYGQFCRVTGKNGYHFARRAALSISYQLFGADLEGKSPQHYLSLQRSLSVTGSVVLS